MLKRILVAFGSPRGSVFYTATINLIVQLVLRGLNHLFPESDFTELGVQLANLLMLLFVHATGELISKAAKPGSPATLADARIAAEAPGGAGGIKGGGSASTDPATRIAS